MIAPWRAISTAGVQDGQRALLLWLRVEAVAAHVFRDGLAGGRVSEAGAIVQPEPWLVQYVIDYSDEMQGLSPWEFQVLFTGLLERMHYRAWLGRKGAAGGVDVFAERDGEFGPERILVQCKHPRPGKKVGVEIVRLLHYTAIEDHATRGLVATDSSFTRNALQHITAYRFQMAGADGNRIRQWLEALRTGAPGAERDR